MEVLDRVSSFEKAFSSSLNSRLDNCVLDLKLAATQSKQQLVNLDLLKDSDDEGEIMLLAMILLQLNGVKLPDQDDLLNKKKRQRTSPDQLAILEEIFQTDKMPNQQTRVQLADQLGMSSRRVQIWFQNKRAKVKRGSSRPDGECPSPNSLSQSTSSLSPSSSPSSPCSPSDDIESPVASPDSPQAVPDINCKTSLASQIIISSTPKAQQLQFSLNHPFVEAQPMLTATY